MVPARVNTPAAADTYLTARRNLPLILANLREPRWVAAMGPFALAVLSGVVGSLMHLFLAGTRKHPR
jgi:hypothetical protein